MPQEYLEMGYTGTHHSPIPTLPTPNGSKYMQSAPISFTKGVQDAQIVQNKELWNCHWFSRKDAYTFVHKAYFQRTFSLAQQGTQITKYTFQMWCMKTVTLHSIWVLNMTSRTGVFREHGNDAALSFHHPYATTSIFVC